MSARTRRWLRRAVYVVGAFIALAMFLTATNAGGEWVFWVRWIGGLAVIGAIAAALLSPSLGLAIIEELFASRGERHLKLLKERATVSGTVGALREYGRAAMLAGEWRDSRDAYAAARAQAPDDREIAIAWALAALRAGKKPQAIDAANALGAVLQADPRAGYGDPWLALGRWHLAERNIDRALDALAQCQKVDAGTLDAIALETIALGRAGRKTEARARFATLKADIASLPPTLRRRQHALMRFRAWWAI
jgi:tetratricopeptide (TPR) repeat protein